MAQEQDISHTPNPDKRPPRKDSTPFILPLQGETYESFLGSAVYPLLAYLASNALGKNDIVELEIPPAPAKRVIIHQLDEESEAPVKSALPFTALKIPSDSFPHAALESLSHLSLTHPEERFQAIWKQQQPNVGLSRFVTPLLIDFNPVRMADRSFIPDVVETLRLERTIRIANAEHLQKKYLSDIPWSGEETSPYRLHSLAQFRHFELLVDELLNASNAIHLLRRPPRFLFGTRTCHIDIDTQTDGTLHSSQEFQKLALAWGILESSRLRPHSPESGRAPLPTEDDLKRPKTLILRMPKTWREG